MFNKFHLNGTAPERILEFTECIYRFYSNALILTNYWMVVH